MVQDGSQSKSGDGSWDPVQSEDLSGQNFRGSAFRGRDFRGRGRDFRGRGRDFRGRGRGWGAEWDGSPAGVLEQQIALTLDHLDRVRSLHHEQLRQLFRVELYVDTELLQRRPRPFSYIDVYRPERDRLKDKLWRLDDERRRLALMEQERVHGLFDRLLALVQKHAYVGE